MPEGILWILRAVACLWHEITAALVIYALSVFTVVCRMIDWVKKSQRLG
jgi:hypothetical protein